MQTHEREAFASLSPQMGPLLGLRPAIEHVFLGTHESMTHTGACDVAADVRFLLTLRYIRCHSRTPELNLTWIDGGE